MQYGLHHLCRKTHIISVIDSKKPALRLLGKKICRTDAKTVFGSNLRNIATDCLTDMDLLTPRLVRDVMTYVVCPETEIWRISILQNLINVRSNDWFLDNFDYNYITTIINNICVD